MSHVVHENVEEYQTEDLNPLVSCLIPHSASLRYIFMILPLFLVLVPEASSDNMSEIRNYYDKILSPIIIYLERLISQNITSSCNTSICYHPFEVMKIPHENATITCLTLCLKIKANCTKFSPHLKNNMKSVSDSTEGILKTNGYPLQPLNHSRCYRQCKKVIKRSDCINALCCLKNVVSALRSWWQIFLYHRYS